MLPVIAGVVLLTAGATAVYKYFTDDENPKKPESESLGTFVLWGRPNAGKTTFIARLRGEKPDPKGKIASTSRTIYSDVQLGVINNKSLRIEKIVDMPGTDDRLNDWLEMILTDAHIFYIVDLSRITDKPYARIIKNDLHATINALSHSGKKKRINIIGSHVDESMWKDLMNDPNLGNIIQAEDEMRFFYESLNKNNVAGYFYFANLNNQQSASQLIQSIVNDCHA